MKPATAGQSGARTALAIGNFDGVHLGHADLVARCRAAAGDAGRVVVLTFDPHPAALLRPGSEPDRLTTFETRAQTLRALGADVVERLAPTRELLDQSAGDFIDHVVKAYNPATIVEGRDFRFGKGREAGVQELAHLGEARGFETVVADPVNAVLGDHSIVTASSTITRWLLRHGRVGDAARVLGRPYAIVGSVERGDRRGRELGFPTANIHSPCLPPADGVYSGVARLPDGRSFPAAISIGTKPTFPGKSRAIEAHVLDAPREGDRIAGLPEYGWNITLAFGAWIRDQAGFDSIQSLIDQIERDCARVRQLAQEPVLCQ